MIEQEHDFSRKSIWHKRLGDIYRFAGEQNISLAYYRQAVLENETNIDALNTLAITDMEQGRWKEGMGRLNKSLNLNKQYFDTYRILGIAFLHENQYQEAIRYLIDAQYYHPDHFEIMRYLALSYLLSNQTEQYQYWLTELFKKGDRADEVLSFMERQLQQRGLRRDVPSLS